MAILPQPCLWVAGSMQQQTLPFTTSTKRTTPSVPTAAPSERHRQPFTHISFPCSSMHVCVGPYNIYRRRIMSCTPASSPVTCILPWNPAARSTHSADIPGMLVRGALQGCTSVWQDLNALKLALEPFCNDMMANDCLCFLPFPIFNNSKQS